MLLLATTAFVLNSPKDDITRSWRMADASVPVMTDFSLQMMKQANPGQEAAVNAMQPQVKSLVEGVRMTFRADGSYIGLTPTQPDQTGTWSLSADGKLLTRTYPDRVSIDTVLSISPTKLRLHSNRPGFPVLEYVPVQ